MKNRVQFERADGKHVKVDTKKGKVIGTKTTPWKAVAKDRRAGRPSK
ncbi:MAG: hypothetical protein LC620_02620 [Halobacteriales archaeon]|nr:hypothetical protein [Halobacteriales archaeon]